MIIENTAKSIATKLKHMNPAETKSIETMTHGLILTMNGAASIASVLLVGLLIGQTSTISVALVSFIILRFFSGGHHLKTAMKCILFSVAIFIAITIITNNLSVNFIFTTSLSIFLLLIFAPSMLGEKTLINKKRYPFMKLASVLIVLSNFYFQSDVIGLTFLVQSILTVHSLKEVKNI
ncbi:putative regulator protein [compost metagenome]